MMDGDDLFALLVLLIERGDGALEISREEVENLDLEGKVLAVMPDEMRNSIRITVEDKENIEVEYVESKEADGHGNPADASD